MFGIQRFDPTVPVVETATAKPTSDKDTGSRPESTASVPPPRDAPSGFPFPSLLPVQSASLPLIKLALESPQNVSVGIRAPTGSGKSLAYLFPILETFANEINGSTRPTKRKRSNTTDVAKAHLELLRRPVGHRGARTVIVLPSRLLVRQVYMTAQCTADLLGIAPDIVVDYGGVPVDPERIVSCDLFIVTLGRLTDHQNIFESHPPAAVVLDEADRLASMDITNVLVGPKSLIAHASTVIAVSATLGAVSGENIDRTFRVFIPGLPPTLQHCVATLKRDGDRSRMLYDNVPDNSIVFCNSIEATKRVASLLGPERARQFDSSVSQAMRNELLRNPPKVIVATDVAGRGLDLPHITTVVNYDLPSHYAVYTHRAGRTARAGKSGRVISLVNKDEHYLLKGFIKRVRSGKERVQLVSVPWALNRTSNYKSAIERVHKL